jgi:hypothetical protein
MVLWYEVYMPNSPRDGFDDSLAFCKDYSTAMLIKKKLISPDIKIRKVRQVGTWFWKIEE